MSREIKSKKGAAVLVNSIKEWNDDIYYCNIGQGVQSDN